MKLTKYYTTLTKNEVNVLYKHYGCNSASVRYFIDMEFIKFLKRCNVINPRGECLQECRYNFGIYLRALILHNFNYDKI